MDINDLRVVITIVTFIAFIGIVAWAYSRNRKHDFDEAARLPFTGKDDGENIGATSETGEKR